MITRIVEEVTVEDLVDGLMEAEMMIRITRMRMEIIVRTRGKTIQIIPMIKKNRDQRGRGRGRGAGR